MSEPLLTIENVHKDDSDVVPKFANDVKGRYIGYFANQHGEQWVFAYDEGAAEALLYGGDVGWNVHPVNAATINGLNLSQDESLWLLACCAAAMPKARPEGLVDAVVKRLLGSLTAPSDKVP